MPDTPMTPERLALIEEVLCLNKPSSDGASATVVAMEWELVSALRAEMEKVKRLREACESAMGMIDALSPHHIEPERTASLQDVLADALNRSRL